MRLTLRIAFLLLLLCTGTATFAQSTEEAATAEEAPALYKNAVKLNLAPLLFGSVNLSYEHRISSYTSAGVTVTAYPKRFTFSERDTSAVYAATAEFRFYPDGKALRGFYVSPYAKYRLLSKNDKPGDPEPGLFRRSERYSEKWDSFGLGLTMGWQEVIYKRIWLNPFIGIGRYVHQSIKDPGGYSQQQVELYTPNPYDLRIGGAFGISF